jgi:hypothetical protein
MPSVSIPQERFMRAEYGRAKAGEPTKTGMNKGKLREWVEADLSLDHKKAALKSQANGGAHATER